jgi:hypothetical protein
MTPDTLFYILQWFNLIAILVTLIFSLFTFRKYTGLIGTALMYLGVGIVIYSFVTVIDLLGRTVEFVSFQRIAGVTYQDVIHSVFATFAFIMVAIGFYKLSRIYKRL